MLVRLGVLCGACVVGDVIHSPGRDNLACALHPALVTSQVALPAAPDDAPSASGLLRLPSRARVHPRPARPPLRPGPSACECSHPGVLE